MVYAMNGRVVLPDSRSKRRIQILLCCRSVRCASSKVSSIVNYDKYWCIFSALPTAAAEQALAQERPSISRYDGSSCCTDMRSGAWAVAAERFAREIVGILEALRRRARGS